MKLVENLTAFAAETSIHGLNFIAKSKTVLMQGIWFPLFTASLAYAIVQIVNEAKCKHTPHRVFWFRNDRGIIGLWKKYFLLFECRKNQGKKNF